MKNVNEIIIRYYTAYSKLSDLIDSKTKGDWSKAELLVKNNDPVQQALDDMDAALSDFEQLTSAGILYQISDNLISLSEIMLRQLSNRTNKEASVTAFLEHIRDDWERKTEDGDVEDWGIVDALKVFFSLPNYDPDAWLKRRFLIRGVRISESSQNVPKKVELGFSEACASFIYGQNIAACALARSVMETALKEKFIVFKNQSLGKIINVDWHKIDKLKEQTQLNENAKKILEAGNNALHEYRDNKVRQLINEFNARSILNNLQKILEYLYK
jgi:hypothetical protein